MLIGLVGKPSVGKSMFFRSATLSEVNIAEYPFTTIKANSGIGYIKIKCVDKEFNLKCQPNYGFCLSNQENYRFIPVEIIDVAGLVPGASEGKGLGNEFLDELRRADIFIHIVDISGKTDVGGKPTENYNPEYDVEFLENELNKWFYNILNKVWKSFSRKTEIQKENLAFSITEQFSGLKINEEQVKKVLRKIDFEEKPFQWNKEQLMKFASELRKESKPMIIAANKIDLPDSKKNYERLKEKFPDLKIIPCSADSELALRQASHSGLINYIPGERNYNILKSLQEKQKQALNKIKNNILNVFPNGTGVQEILNSAVFDILGYIAVFPVSSSKLTDTKGNILPDCFLLPKASTALDFAYHIHEDFGKNFIKAIDARTKKILGKDYELKHRDVLEIIAR